MSLKVELGLFNLDFIDYHAILGVAVDTDPKDIRKQYLKIARRLHPDSCTTEDEAERQHAAELLSKLVNPAYEKLSQDSNYKEYCALLQMKGESALKQQETVILVSDAARKLASTRGEVEQSYRAALKQLAEKQYQALNQTLEVTGHLSELNLVYLMWKAKQGNPAPAQKKATGSSKPAPPPPPPLSPKEQLVASALRRADEFAKKQDYSKAILEIRRALQEIDPNSSVCHSRLGDIYIKTNLPSMAKIHFNQALKLNPKDSAALEGLQKLEQTTGTTNPGTQKSSGTSKPAPKGGKDNSGGGLFGLFGGKKK